MLPALLALSLAAQAPPLPDLRFSLLTESFVASLDPDPLAVAYGTRRHLLPAYSPSDPLLAPLASPSLPTRDAGTSALFSLGWAALPSLLKGMHDRDPEVVERCGAVLGELVKRANPCRSCKGRGWNEYTKYGTDGEKERFDCGWCKGEGWMAGE